MAEQIIQTEYSDVMQKSYIDYAMSVICSRALPDVRDGLKPVQRRVLYAMDQLKLKHDEPHRKSARIVGDTMGKYHPHGDSSIYETLVGLAQDFKKSETLVDGHGNFGSIEGDGAAAMRYTEARLSKFAEEVYLADLNQDTVDFVSNFDETEKEPTVLPTRVPNILVNGADGIAVGMTTSIPPHNLLEVIDALIAYMDNQNISTEEILKIMPGPDFPTGGIVANKSELVSIYESGIGKIKLRGKVVFEKGKSRGRDRLVVTEIPYTMIGTGIGKFLSDVVDLVETKKTTDIVDISNESGKDGIRIVLELKKGADVDKLVNMLYKKTRLEDTFGVSMIAIANGRPEVMGIKDLIRYSVDFQYDLTRRKYTAKLDKALEQKEIREGLIKATDIIDLIIEIIRGCQNQKQVKDCLVNGNVEGIKFKNPESKIQALNLSFTQRQAQAILDMRLSKLIGLEIEALRKEYEDLIEQIARYEEILSDKKVMADVIKNDLLDIKKEFGKPRKTVIENGKEAVFDEEAFVEREVVFVQDRFGYAKILDPSVFDRNRESITAENKYYFNCMNTDSICIFTDNGNVHQIKLIDVPQKRAREKGVPIDNLGNYSSNGEEIVALFCMSDIRDKNLLFATSTGMVKLVNGSEFDTNRKTVSATKLVGGDTLLAVIPTRVSDVARQEEMPVFLTGGSNEETSAMGQMEFGTGYDLFDTEMPDLQYTREILILQTRDGIFLRFPIKEVPKLRKNAVGVHGIKLMENDLVTNVYLLDTGDNKVIEYNGKQIDLRKLKTGRRGTKGVKVRA